MVSSSYLPMIGKRFQLSLYNNFISYQNCSTSLLAIEHVHESEDIKVVGRQSWSTVVVVAVVVQLHCRLATPIVLHSVLRVQIESVQLENSELDSLAVKLNDLNGDRSFELLHFSAVKTLSSAGGNSEGFEYRSAFELIFRDRGLEDIFNVEVRVVQQDGVWMRERTRRFDCWNDKI